MYFSILYSILTVVYIGWYAICIKMDYESFFYKKKVTKSSLAFIDNDTTMILKLGTLVKLFSF